MGSALEVKTLGQNFFVSAFKRALDSNRLKFSCLLFRVKVNQNKIS